MRTTSRRIYRRMTPAELVDAWRVWHSLLGAWFDYAAQHGDGGRTMRRALRCYLRHLRRIEEVAAARDIHLDDEEA
jgi:hypothetical protein